MDKEIKQLENVGCVMIPGLYKELGDSIEEAKYFYFTSAKNKTIGFGALALIDERYAIVMFGSDSMPLGWGLVEDFIEGLQEELKNES